MTNKKRVFGLNYYKTSLTFKELSTYIATNDIVIQQIEQKDDILFFYSVPFYHFKLTSNKEINYIRTIGLLGIVWNQIKQRRKRLLLIYISILWYVFSHCIIHYEITGVDQKMKDTLMNYVHQKYPLYRPYFNFDEEFVKEDIYDNYLSDLSWVEVRKEGLSLNISFLARHYGEKEDIPTENIYAKKEGVVAYYIVQHGDILVKKDDYVKEGDLLIRNYLVDPFQQEKKLYVKGKVYGYTWYTIDVQIPKEDSYIKPLTFFRLLLDARSIAAKNLQEDEKIVEENILHFTDDSSTIKMRVYYMLLEDITRP